jgi:hypothetical protein
MKTDEQKKLGHILNVSYKQSQILFNRTNGAIFLLKNHDFRKLVKGVLSENTLVFKELSESRVLEVEEASITSCDDNFLITIELSTACNLSCVYCYQEKNVVRKEISQSTLESIYTYIENVLEINEKAIQVSSNALMKDENILSEVYNVAFGGNTTLNELFLILRDTLSQFDKKISLIEPIYGPFRPGDIPHSQASIEKAINQLNYSPKYCAREGFKIATEWYLNNLK